MKFYITERTVANPLYATINTPIKWRFRSLFNNIIGPWRNTKSKAEKDGNNHKAVIIYMTSFESLNWKKGMRNE